MPRLPGSDGASPTVTPPGARAWAVGRGAGHYGAAFTRYLDQQSETALEVGRSLRRSGACAARATCSMVPSAARSALAAEQTPRGRGPASAKKLRVLLHLARFAAPPTSVGHGALSYSYAA